MGSKQGCGDRRVIYSIRHGNVTPLHSVFHAFVSVTENDKNCFDIWLGLS